jgi:MinD-like ATPase involved in chromosome partitioning or flagellar assembly
MSALHRAVDGDQAVGLRRLFTRAQPRVVGVLGEEGASVALELALALGAQGLRVLVLDRGRGEVAHALGRRLRYELRHALAGDCPLHEVALDAGPGVVAIPAARALERLDAHAARQWWPLFAMLDDALGPLDAVLVNGAPPAVAEAAVLLALSPTSKAVTHAYTALKQLARRTVPGRCDIVVHRARSEAAALDAFDSVALTAGRFLGMSLALAGTLPDAPGTPRVAGVPGVPGMAGAPGADAARALAAARIAQRLLASAPAPRPLVHH